MTGLLWVAYSALTAIIPALIVYGVAGTYRRHQGLPRPGVKVPLLVLLALYVGLVFYITGLGTLYDFLRVGFEYRPEEINFIPFLFDSYSMQYVLNVVMFVPLGILLPLVWPRLSKVRYILGFSFGFSLYIELSQLLNRRASDVDDLIMNVLGALIGFVLFLFIQNMRRKNQTAQSPVIHAPVKGAGMPALYFVAMAAGNFFLYNGLGLAMLLTT